MKTRIGLSAVVGAALVLAGFAGPAAAAPLRNDAIASPVVIGAVPYTNTQDTRRASTGPTDPSFCFEPGGPADSNTVWYSYTATETTRLAVDTFGSNYDTTLYVGTPDGAGGIEVFACVDDSADGLQSYVGFDAVAGTTYLFMVGTCCASPGTGNGGSLVLNLGPGQPPLVLDVAVAPTGSVDRGVVTVTGTATCSEPTDFTFIDLVLTQRVGQRTIEGGGSTEFSTCGPTATDWTIVLEGFNGRFAGGTARGEVTSFTCALECVTVTESVTVKLR